MFKKEIYIFVETLCKRNVEIFKRNPMFIRFYSLRNLDIIYIYLFFLKVYNSKILNITIKNTIFVNVSLLQIKLPLRII